LTEKRSFWEQTGLKIADIAIDTGRFCGNNDFTEIFGAIVIFLGSTKMRVTDLLDKSGVKYELTSHTPAFSAQTMAAATHESGKYVAKPVIVKVDDKYVMCVCAASRKVDLRALKTQLGAKSAELAQEEEIGKLFDDCELGAQPPFGNLYDIATIMDKAMEKDDHILFQAGSHEKSIRSSRVCSNSATTRRNPAAASV
jgi:Ala-tRNA(Pro) deacylase